jgi:hypothetical protein
MTRYEVTSIPSGEPDGEQFRAVDLGHIDQIVEYPTSYGLDQRVAWVNFPGISLGKVLQYEGRQAWKEASIPVSSEELEQAGYDVKEGEWVWADVNLGAQDRGDADPLVQTNPPEPSAEDFEAFDKGN